MPLNKHRSPPRKSSTIHRHCFAVLVENTLSRLAPRIPVASSWSPQPDGEQFDKITAANLSALLNLVYGICGKITCNFETSKEV